RDKDAIQIVPLLIKYKNLLANNGLTFKDEMEDIYKNIGTFKDRTLAPSFEGSEGVEKINRIMNYFRNNELSTLCGLEVKKVEDYESGYLTDKIKGTTESLTLPKANLIRFVFDEGFIALRPSGTEPKMKIYFSLNVEDIDKISTEFVNQYIDSIK
ncbi:phosphoglucomutase, partial [Staphylococcus gallinarum]